MSRRTKKKLIALIVQHGAVEHPVRSSKKFQFEVVTKAEAASLTKKPVNKTKIICEIEVD